MKKISIFLALLFKISAVSGCSHHKEKIVITEVELPTFENLGNKEFDVLELEFIDGKPVYTDIGDIKDGKYYLLEDNKVKSLKFIPEYILSEETKSPKKTGKYVCSLPWWYANRLREKETDEYIKEGLIIFDRNPFLCYQNKKDGITYVKCLIEKFDSYFDEDRSYIDFINFAVNHEPEPYNLYNDMTSK